MVQFLLNLQIARGNWSPSILLNGMPVEVSVNSSSVLRKAVLLPLGTPASPLAGMLQAFSILNLFNVWSLEGGTAGTPLISCPWYGCLPFSFAQTALLSDFLPLSWLPCLSLPQPH